MTVSATTADGRARVLADGNQMPRTRAGTVQVLRGALLAHLVHGARGGHRAGAREAVEQYRQAEEMVGVAVGDVDRGELALVQRDPVGQRRGLGDGHERIHEYGVTGSEDERRRLGIPGRRVADPGRRCSKGRFRCGKYVVTQKRTAGRHVSSWIGGCGRGHFSPWRLA